jgi:acetyl-CoA acetyltransferase family protein
VSVHDIGKASVAAAIERSGIPPDEVDDLVMGEVMQGGGCLARYLALDLGLPPDLPGLAVNRACASGLSAVTTAAAGIRAGMDRVVVAGGVESMTQAPASFMKSPMAWGGMTPWISPSHPETPDAPTLNMGVTVGENTAAQCGITRDDQDAWALRSHQRAAAATDEGRFADEIVEMKVPGGRNELRTFDIDEHPRRDTSLERLAALPASFQPGGTVTAGNSSSLNDGSCALVLCADGYASDHGLEPLAVVRSWAAAGVPPRETGIAPTIAIPRALILDRFPPPIRFSSLSQ